MAEALLDGRYRLGARLGAGGMGVVEEALDVQTNRTVAIKTLPGASHDERAARRRFAREVQAVARIRSAHVVELLGHGVSEAGRPYLVMERLRGRDLGELLDRFHQLSVETTTSILVQLADALDAAHALGIVHRDVKPSNVFLAEAGDGRALVKLLDFGIAKELCAPAEGTTTDAAIGTPLYMSPEQIVARPTIDHRSDLWSLGVVAFRALSGAPPFRGESIGALAVTMCSGELPSLHARRFELPPAVDGWFARACALDAAQRFESGRALVEALCEALGVAVPEHGPFRLTGSERLAAASTSSLPTATLELGAWARESTHGPAPLRRWRWLLAAAVAAAVSLSVLQGLREPPVVGQSAPATDGARKPAAATPAARPAPAAVEPRQASALTEPPAHAPSLLKRRRRIERSRTDTPAAPHTTSVSTVSSPTDPDQDLALDERR
jgi:serine/threonine protein kinase